jgi:hypothetical protein
MDSKNTYLKNIIREEVKRVKEFTEPKPITPTKPTKPTTTPTKPTTDTTKKLDNPFKTVQSSDHFRKWIYQRHREEAVKLGITQTGPLYDPKLIKVFPKWKNAYWADIKTAKETKKNIKNNTSSIPGGDFLRDFSAADMMKYGVYAALAAAVLTGVIGSAIVRRFTRKIKTKLTPAQAYSIASNPQEFQRNIDKFTKANPRALRKELQKLNTDEILTDDDVIKMQQALGDKGRKVAMLIQARQTVLQDFISSVKQRKLPTHTASEVINTLTPFERARYAPYIRSLYAKAQKKKEFKQKAKSWWDDFRDKLPYGD